MLSKIRYFLLLSLLVVMETVSTKASDGSASLKRTDLGKMRNASQGHKEANKIGVTSLPKAINTAHSLKSLCKDFQGKEIPEPNMVIINAFISDGAHFNNEPRPKGKFFCKRSARQKFVEYMTQVACHVTTQNANSVLNETFMKRYLDITGRSFFLSENPNEKLTADQANQKFSIPLLQIANELMNQKDPKIRRFAQELVKAIVTAPSDREEGKKVIHMAEQFYFPIIYKEKMPLYTKMIVSEDTYKEVEKASLSNKDKKVKSDSKRSNKHIQPFIIHNNTLYADEGTCSPANVYCQKGKEIFYQKNPIGYTIYMLPVVKPKAILVEFYGGYKKADLKDSAMRPEDLMEWEKELNEDGILIIKLNVPDLLINTKFQFDMDKNIHDIIQGSVDYFYKMLKKGSGSFINTPKNLEDIPQYKDEKIRNNKELFGFRDIEKLPVFLYGASFGGRGSVRHAEMFPGTFDGYISHDGALSFKTLDESGALILGGVKRMNTKNAEWLSPMDEKSKGDDDAKISKIRDDIHVIHNMDDNNVNIRVSQAWVDRAEKVRLKMMQKNKGKPTFMLSFKKFAQGNLTPDQQNDLHNKGHYTGHDPSYAKDIIGFINGVIENKYANKISATTGKNKDSKKILKEAKTQNLQKYQVKAGSTLAGGQQLFNRLPLQEQFLAEAYAYYLRHPDEQQKILELLSSPTPNVPPFQSLYYAVKIVNDDKKIQGAVSQVVGALSDKKSLVLKNFLSKQLPIFINFVKEIKVLPEGEKQISQGNVLEGVYPDLLIKPVDIINDPKLMDEMRGVIVPLLENHHKSGKNQQGQGDSLAVRARILKDILLANPQLSLKIGKELYGNTPMTSNQEYQALLGTLKNVFYQQGVREATAKEIKKKKQDLGGSTPHVSPKVPSRPRGSWGARSPSTP